MGDYQKQITVIIYEFFRGATKDTWKQKGRNAVNFVVLRAPDMDILLAI